MKALNKKDLFNLIDDNFPGEYTVIFEDELHKLLEENGEDWFIDIETKSWKKID